MKRRQFISRSIMPAILPALLPRGLLARQVPLGDVHHSAGAEPRQYFFYDDRFPTAKSLARDWGHRGALLPVRGDVTALWNRALKTASLESPLQVAGITTESFFFCLQRLLQSGARVQASTHRIDRYLLQWSITTGKRSS